MENPVAYFLETLPISWDVFGTLSLKPRDDNDKHGTKLFFAWLRKVGEVWRVPWKTLFWVQRTEFGGRNGRLHYHILLSHSVLGSSETTCRRLMFWYEWVGGGVCRMRRFDPGRDWSEYMNKSETAGVNVSGNRYEISRFGNASRGGLRSGGAELRLSDTVVRMVRRVRMNSATQSPARYNSTDGIGPITAQ